ncbi:MAG: PAS domain-containing protein, partial [Desulfovibrionaceae bacterium]
MGKLFGDYVREKRKALQANDPGYSIRGVARRLGIHHSYLSKIERGEQASLSATKLVALANILGIDSDTLLAMDGKLSHDVQRAVLHCPEIFPRLVQALHEPRPDSELERARFLGPHFRRFQRDLDLMVRNSSLGMCICMRDGVLLEANPGLARLLECPLDELPGVSLRRLLSGLGQNFWSDSLRRLETGEAESVQQGFLHQRPGGGSRWMDLRLVRLPDGGGEFYRLFGMLGDKTDAHEDQLRLLRNAELHQTLVEALHEGVWQVDPAGLLTFVSASLARLLGYGQTEMLGRPLTDFLDSGTARQFRLDLARQGFGPRVWRDGMLLSRQGRGVSALLESLPWFDGQGRFAGSIGAVLRAEDARWARRGEAAAYRQLRVIADNLRQHVHYVDADGICRFANALFEEACGVGRDGCIGHPVRQLLGAECSRQVEPLLRRVLTGERVYAERLTLALPQGERLMDVLCLPDRTEHGEVLGGYVLARESAAGRERSSGGELLSGLAEYYGALPVAAWVVDADLRVLWANRIHQDLCGPWVGQRCHEARDGREAPCPGCPCGKAFQGGGGVSRGQVHVCRDGVCMDFIVHAGGCAWDEAGRPTQVLCLACDVTDLQRRRWALRERL